MIQKELMQLLSDFSDQQTESKSYENRAIYDSQFDDLSKAIIKAFTRPQENHWPDEIRIEMVEKSELYSEPKVYQYGYYDGYHKANELKEATHE